MRGSIEDFFHTVVDVGAVDTVAVVPIWAGVAGEARRRRSLVVAVHVGVVEARTVCAAVRIHT